MNSIGVDSFEILLSRFDVEGPVNLYAGRIGRSVQTPYFPLALEECRNRGLALDY